MPSDIDQIPVPAPPPPSGDVEVEIDALPAVQSPPAVVRSLDADASSTGSGNPSSSTAHDAAPAPSTGPSPSPGTLPSPDPKTLPKNDAVPNSRLHALRQSYRSIHWWWWWEILAATLSLTCIALIVVTLAVMHNKPLSDWTLQVSINAVVAILTTVSKSALLLLVAESIGQLKWLHFEDVHALSDLQAFDEATRGPWGAAAFALRTRGKALLTVLGCLVTVFSLGFEPAAQQMLSFPSRVVPAPNASASIAIASAFRPKEPFRASYTNTSATFRIMAPFQLSRSLLGGVTGSIVDGLQECSTAECRFDDMTTFGLCTSCRNITNETRERLVEDADRPLVFRRIYTFDDPFYEPLETEVPSLSLLELTDFFVLAFSGGNLRATNVTTPRRIGFVAVAGSDVTACDFFWCRRTHRNLRINNGVLVSTEDEPTPLDPARDINLFNVQTIFVSGNIVQDLLSLPLVGPPEDQPTPDDDRVMWDYIALTLQGLSTNNTFTNLISRQNVSLVASNIADAITNFMRGPGNANTTVIEGRALAPVTFVHVRWAWIIWPSALTIAGTVLLVVSIVKNWGRPYLLKSNALALLFHGLEGFDHDQLVPPHKEDGTTLDTMVEGLKVRFARNGEGTLKFMRAS